MRYMSECLFCKIIAGEIPAHKIYEDEDTIAFLDIFPVAYGHTLVIPKKHSVNILDAEASALQAVMSTIAKLSPKIKETLQATGINIVNASGKDAQQSVDHLHFHIVPRYPSDGIDLWFHGK